MPIGSSKLGVLGAGLVPGGSVTFNTSGNWSVPPGVKKVSITGRGATGNPGNPGNPGNAGNPGGGGGGGGGAASSLMLPSGNVGNAPGSCGGNAFKASTPNNWTSTNPLIPTITIGGARGNTSSNTPYNQANSGSAGQSGDSGNAGSAGNAGNPGNPGNASSGLGNNFAGGAGGNAGVAGAAGNGGTGGQGGGGGNAGQFCTPNGGSGGSGGNGGGSGGNGARQNRDQMQPTMGFITGGFGGGGAGAINSGASGGNAIITATNPSFPSQSFAAGGSGQVDAPVIPPANPLNPRYPGLATSIMGGYGGGINQAVAAGSPALLSTFNSGSNPTKTTNCFNPPFVKPGGVNDPGSTTPGRIQCFTSNYNPGPLRPEVFRSGGGGGAATVCASFSRNPNIPQQFFSLGGGGGGGGRGNAGNAGGTSPTPTGTAGTPQTFNCVTVTPGATTPIVVGTPGGQIVISWNPQ